MKQVSTKSKKKELAEEKFKKKKILASYFMSTANSIEGLFKRRINDK